MRYYGVLWVMVLHSLVDGQTLFRGNCCLCLRCALRIETVVLSEMFLTTYMPARFPLEVELST
jgi:hypothetical protein